MELSCCNIAASLKACKTLIRLSGALHMNYTIMIPIHLIIFFSLCHTQVAIWSDETLALAGPKLEFPATSFPEFENSNIKCVYTSSLHTCAWLENGALFWW